MSHEHWRALRSQLFEQHPRRRLAILCGSRSTMDPHSRMSQYNRRRPSVGPNLQQLKKVESKPPAVNGFEQFKHSTGSSAKGSSAATASPKPKLKSLSGFTARPIASNARLRRDEQYKSDLCLAFIDGALAEKAKVRCD